MSQYKISSNNGKLKYRMMTNGIYRLPKLNMSTFDGTTTKWLGFWDQFEPVVDKNSTLTDVDKFAYLKMVTKGDASTLLSEYRSYKTAIEEFKHRYGNKETLLRAHYQAFFDCPPVRTMLDVDTLDRTFNVLWSHLSTLRSLGEEINHNSLILQLERKLPIEFVKDIQMRKYDEIDRNQEWSMDKLFETIERYITIQQQYTTMTPTPPTPAARIEERQQQQQRQYDEYPSPIESETEIENGSFIAAAACSSANSRRSGSAYRTPRVPDCAFCSARHFSDECERYTNVDERRSRLDGKCYVCLRAGHVASDCRNSKACFHCGMVGAHHSALCRDR